MKRIDAGQQALRRGRSSLAGGYYLITTCIHDRQPLLREWVQARQVIHAMRHLHEERCVTSLSFVVMPDHLHWLIQLREGDELAGVVRRFKGRSARSLNESLGHHGTIWQPGYHDRAIRGERDLKQTARYIVANPLRAGLVQEIGQYPHWDAIWL
ncbi:REP element-mobilizing transposase RayT [Kushneria sinocarnis]|uniref:REP element-mobilizing transposase RayT n=1 Tax=Kushneria sinocarnis TaxID=595502 RepID=A0A420WWZ7_9GAMM|nr:transposase [Kushneria sinocarnis]RKR04238.1 REP element-mobilizing transposase RayT [Kushneria sinocarnis]